MLDAVSRIIITNHHHEPSSRTIITQLFVTQLFVTHCMYDDSPGWRDGLRCPSGRLLLDSLLSVTTFLGRHRLRLRLGVLLHGAILPTSLVIPKSERVAVVVVAVVKIIEVQDSQNRVQGVGFIAFRFDLAVGHFWNTRIHRRCLIHDLHHSRDPLPVGFQHDNGQKTACRSVTHYQRTAHGGQVQPKTVDANQRTRHGDQPPREENNECCQSKSTL
mmetsp:Transcript_6151/g.17477  ORF Transcript_6151/g.17477 Transcript_6151/m.17477 type:complete len:217 (-) Transcript_6151:2288-2938(-)